MSEEEQVRRLLAEARHDEPMPADVAGRLDGVLADLRAERPVRPVVADLAAARRRRRAGALLVAAAAVVVAGVGLDQLRGGGQADSTAGGSASVAEDAPPSPPRTSAEAGSDANGTNDTNDSVDGGGAAALVPLPSGHLVRLDEDRFARQVDRIRQRLVLSRSAGELDSQSATAGQRYELDTRPRCSVADVGAGQLVPVRYAGTPGVLVYRKVTGDSQVVDLFLCGRDGPGRSVTLPAP